MIDELFNDLNFLVFSFSVEEEILNMLYFFSLLINIFGED